MQRNKGSFDKVVISWFVLKGRSILVKGTSKFVSGFYNFVVNVESIIRSTDDTEGGIF